MVAEVGTLCHNPFIELSVQPRPVTPIPKGLKRDRKQVAPKHKSGWRQVLFEEIGVFYRGLVLGLMIAAPVGPIGLLCTRRTIHKGLLIGFVTGLGAAGADTIFGAIAAFSVAVIMEFLREYNHHIRLLGGAFLLFVAWHTWHDPPRQPPKNNSASATGVVTALLSGFIITMTNPVTMVAILAVVATFGGLHSDRDALIIVAGIFGGSTLWWAILSCGVSAIRNHFTESRVMLINRITAVALAVLALWAVVSSVAGFMGHKLLF
jgi:threonine/homoserine/homoserine lactone efflux protein